MRKGKNRVKKGTRRHRAKKSTACQRCRRRTKFGELCQFCPRRD